MRTVHFHVDRLRLAGSLFLPEERPEAGVPAVVFCHGFGATREYVAADREHAGALYAAAREPKELLTLPDATHHDIYRGHHFDEVVDAAARWLGAHLDKTHAEVRNK
ncbi:hypothetical protein [Phytohabitans kaempferiae]|uniref:Serine aminopeptidase S33 domain-containing protein n=1 Tax=Phytohabitans kaempferiae TaxID=1620943 RepID=A0ABV6M212_9ACTN